jgi:para-aminobenzoate synthetase component 1
VTTEINRLAAEGVPFLFIIDFEMEKPLIFELSDIDPGILLYDLDGISNQGSSLRITKHPVLVKHPQPFDSYLSRFTLVTNEILFGNSYLLNLTCATPIELNLSPEEIFHAARARFRILLKGEFVCFSPEAFVIIRNNRISSFPMKGTIDAAIPDAERIILNDRKETAEHFTMVDLIRNDLSRVSSAVNVERLRYVEEIVTHEKKLLQVSSEICGVLDHGWRKRLGEILFSLLPAGSVSGAPKGKTLEIIRKAEQEKRGYYTGIAGIFTGDTLISSVLIRYIETTQKGYIYRSGGGITALSNPMQEYEEMINKIYVPVV